MEAVRGKSLDTQMGEMPVNQGSLMGKKLQIWWHELSILNILLFLHPEYS